jgi:exopolysaccharide production protein ExoQ
MVTLVTLLWVFSSFDSTPRWFGPIEEGTEGVLRVVLACACLAGIALTLRLGLDLGRLLRASPAFWLLVGLAGLSCVWSSRPLVSLHSVAALLAAALLGYLMHRRLSLQQLVKLIAWVMGGMVLVSLVAVLVVPDLAIHDQASLKGSWRGLGIRASLSEGALIPGHRNQFGMFVVLEMMALLLMVGWCDGRSRLIALALLPLMVLLLQPIGSATAFVLVTLVVLVAALAWLSERRRAWRAPALVSMALMPAVAFIGRVPLTGVLDRSPSLTRRTEIWEHMADVVMRRPLLGYGYGLQWTRVPELEADLLQHGRPWQASIHSGYVSWAFWLGIVGAVLLVVLLLLLLWSASSRFLEGEPGLERVFPLMLLLVLLVAAIPESRMLSGANYFTVLFAFLAFHLRDTGASGVSPPVETTASMD